MAGHCGRVRAYMLLLLVVCLLVAASGLDFPHYHHASVHSSTANWYRYDPEAVIAIDLGNTNSCVAGYTRGGPVETTTTMFRVCIPSWVAFPDDGSVLVGDVAKNHAETHPEAAIFGFKRMLGLRYEEDTVQRLIQRVPYKIGSTRYGIGPAIQLDAKDDGASVKELHVQEIATMVVDELRKKAEDHLGVRTVRDALIVVPEHSTYASTQEARDAGRMAGLDVLGTVTEPIAAAVAYGLDEKMLEDGNANVLVLHVGGGTAEASVVTLTDGGYFDVLAYRYDPFLGGDDFDRSVVDYFVDLIKIKHGKDVSHDSVALRKLGVACERAKKVLSSQDHAQVSIESLFGDGMDFSELLSRSTFEKLNGDLFWKVIVLVHSAMAESELERSKIDEILLVGGSTMIPKIQRLVKVYFNGKEPNVGVKPDEAVALGAAVKIQSLKYRRFESLDLL